MVFEDYKSKPSVVIVYTGDGKGKTTASLGLMARALGAGWHVAYIQFIKKWKTNEQKFIDKIQPVFKEDLYFYQSGAGFYNAGKLSAKDVSPGEHKALAQQALKKAQECATNGQYQLVICDEINNAVQDGLISKKQLVDLINNRLPQTSICITGRGFPPELLPLTDIATSMQKLKHHFDDKFLANPGIDY